MQFQVLQGFMFLTDTYLCYFAHLPSQEVINYLSKFDLSCSHGASRTKS